MSCLRHCFKRGRAFLLKHSDVLSPEGVPTKTLEIEPEVFGRWTNHASKNRSIIHRFAKVFKHVLFWLRTLRLQLPVTLHQDPQRQEAFGPLALGLAGVASVKALLDSDNAVLKIHASPLQT